MLVSSFEHRRIAGTIIAIDTRDALTFLVASYVATGGQNTSHDLDQQCLPSQQPVMHQFVIIQTLCIIIHY
jgi:hypothetical protein